MLSIILIITIPLLLTLSLILMILKEMNKKPIIEVVEKDVIPQLGKYYYLENTIGDIEIKNIIVDFVIFLEGRILYFNKESLIRSIVPIIENDFKNEQFSLRRDAVNYTMVKKVLIKNTKTINLLALDMEKLFFSNEDAENARIERLTDKITK